MVFFIGFSLALWVTSFLLPNQFLPWISWHKEVLAFASVILAGWALFLSRKKIERYWSIPTAIQLWVAMAVWAGIQYGFTQIEFLGEVIVLGLYFFLSIVAWAVGRRFAENTDKAKKLAEIVAACFLALALTNLAIALSQTLQVWESSPWLVQTGNVRRPGGNLAQANHFATLQLMGLASLLYLHEQRRLGSAVWFGLAMLLNLGLAISESRTGLLSFMLLFAYWYYGRLQADMSRVQPWCWGMTGGALLGLYWIWPQWISGTVHLATQVGQLNTSPGLRPIVWRQLLEAVYEQPWMGWGLNEVPKALHSTLAKTQPIVSEAYTFSHNIFLDLVIGVGLPLALLIIGACMLWLLRRWRSIRNPTSWYCLALVLPLAVHSMLEFPFAYAYFLVPAMLMLGVFDKLSGTTSTLVVRVQWVGVSFFVATAISIWTVVEYINIEEDFRVLRFEDLRVGQTPENYERPEICMLTQLEALLTAGRIVPRPGMTASEIEQIRQVVLRFPWPAVQNRYALSLALNGDIDMAHRELKIMKAMHSAANYAAVRKRWEVLAEHSYPQLQRIPLP